MRLDLFSKLSPIAIAIIALGNFSAYGGTPNLSSENQALFENESFRPIMKASELPVPVRASLGIDANPKKMANPGENWGVGCTSPGLPSQRLIIAGASKDFCIVHSERGGRAHSFLVQLYKLRNNESELLSTLSTKRAFKSLSEVIDYLKGTNITEK